MTDTNSARVRVLLIEDDEDDYVLVRDLLSEVASTRYEIEWAATYDAALDAMGREQYDACLLDYRLGERTGIDLLRETLNKGCGGTVILLTGQGDYNVDVEAMRAGAADYLVKDQINGPLLERSIRYAMERKRSEDALRKSEKQLRELSAQLLSAQETERKRIAGELHDGIGQILSALRFGVEKMISDTNAGRAGQDPQTPETVLQMIEHAAKEVRRMSTALRPSILDDLGIVATIGWFCREFGVIQPSIRIEREVQIREEEVSDPLKIIIYRVIQEAFNNVAKHSQANEVQLSLTKRDEAIELLIQDNGVGFDPKDFSLRVNGQRGFGLTSMKERVELSGGCYRIEPIRGAGTSVRASWRFHA